MICLDCLHHDIDFQKSYCKNMENNPKKAISNLIDDELTGLDYEKLNGHYEYGWYGKMDNPENILKELQRIYPNHKDEIRQLFARIFDAETANTLPPKNVANEKTNRGNHSIKGGKNQEDILDIDPGEWPNIGKEVSSKDTDSGFFDSDNQVKTQKKDKRVIHNDEFDF